MTVSIAALQQALQSVAEPLGAHGPAASHLQAAKMVRKLEESDGQVTLDLVLPYPAQTQHASLRTAIEQAFLAVPGVRGVSVTISQHIIAHAVQTGLKPLPGVKNVIAVASGKGGVGKSTVAANLALALSAEGARVGMLDADIYGPSQPLMFGLQGQQPVSEDGKSITPLQQYGVQVMSIGFMVDTDQAVIWRGPMVSQALQQMLNDTRWDALDYLVIDLPPGTGDIQLTLAQKVPVTGAVVVTTPQDLALLDARRGFRMFEKVRVPVLGLVENMSTHVCSQCGHEEAIFGHGGADRMAADYGLELLGSLPLAMAIRSAADAGRPTVVADPDGAHAAAYGVIARRVGARIAALGQDFSNKFPKIVIQNT